MGERKPTFTQPRSTSTSCCGYSIRFSGFRARIPQIYVAMGYPLVNVYKKLWKITICYGKTHYKWPFSIAMLNYQRVKLVFLRHDPQVLGGRTRSDKDNSPEQKIGWVTALVHSLCSQLTKQSKYMPVALSQKEWQRPTNPSRIWWIPCKAVTEEMQAKYEPPWLRKQTECWKNLAIRSLVGRGRSRPFLPGIRKVVRWSTLDLAT